MYYNIIVLIIIVPGIVEELFILILEYTSKYVALYVIRIVVLYINTTRIVGIDMNSTGIIVWWLFVTIPLHGNRSSLSHE